MMSLNDQLRDRFAGTLHRRLSIDRTGNTRICPASDSLAVPQRYASGRHWRRTGGAKYRPQSGYVQPVRITVPAGAVLSLAYDGEFPVATTDLRAGLMLGQAYRLRITNIPRHEDQELYPSIEVIDRLHPPRGQKNRFPIPIEITQDDLELALRGSMIVRVIYLENPNEAFPRAEDDHQRYLDVLPSEDPLHVADELGRPMAILRLGSRVPLSSDIDSTFLFGSPPVEWLSDASG